MREGVLFMSFNVLLVPINDFLAGLVVKGKEELLLSWRGNEGGGVVHVFQCPIGSYSMLFLSGLVFRGKEEVMLCGRGNEGGGCCSCLYVLLVPIQ